MNHIHCSAGIPCPSDLSFLYRPKFIRRAGIIPFMVDTTGNTYILMGLSKDKNPVWADLGGRSEDYETPLQTALREYGEESRWVLPADLNRLSKILITGPGKPDQILLLVEVDPTDNNITIDNKFQQTVPRTQYEDEMHYLRWIPYNQFLTMNGLSRSMRQIQALLKSL